MEKSLTSGNALSGINSTFNAIREEFDEHRESINDNTSEIQANYEYLLRLDEKIEKLAEKIEALMINNKTDVAEKQAEIKLTEQEKAVFLLIYCASEKPVTYKEIAEVLKQSELLVSEYVTAMIEKGVPIKKRYMHNTAFLELDKGFHDMQAKHNMLGISQTTMKRFA